MAESGNLGEYKVVISARYTDFISAIEDVVKKVEDSAELIKTTLATIPEAAGKSFSELAATMKNVGEQSGEIDYITNATTNAGKAAESTAGKYKSLQLQVSEAARNADKAWQSGNGFSSAKNNFEEPLNRLIEFKKELGTLSIGSEKGIYSNLLRSVDEGGTSFKILTDRIKELNAEQQRLKESTSSQTSVAAPISDVSKEREQVLQEEQKIRRAIAAQELKDSETQITVDNKKFQQEQAGIERLGAQYENMYRRVASYIESNTKMSAQSFTKMKSDMDSVAAKMSVKGASPIAQNPLAGFNYDQYAAGFTKIDDAIKKTSKSVGTLSGMFNMMKMQVEMVAGMAIIAAPIMAVKSIADIEQQMAGMIQTLPQLHNNQAAVNDVSKQFIGIGEQYGMEVDKIIEAGKLWSRGYKDVSDVMRLTGLSAKLSVADMMDVGLANRAVESVINSYGRQADAVSFATHVVDSWTNVAHNSQTSATDLAEALMRSAAAAHVVGVSFDTTTALAATMIKTTGMAGGNVGNALKSMFASIHSDKAIADLKSLGVEVYNFDKDGTAHFRNIASVMTDVMLKTHETSKDMQKDLQDLAGGKFQWSKAAALFGDYADFIKTYNLSINSVGFSDGQIAAQMDTINRKIQQVKASMDGLLMNVGNSGLTSVIKGSLTEINNFLQGLQRIPSVVYQVAGAGIMLAGTWYAASKVLAYLNAGVVGLRAALVTTVPAKIADAAATGVEAEALDADIIATNADTMAKSRLAVATSVATGGMNLIFAALTAAAIGGTVYATSLGAAGNASENALQKNEDLIAAKKQEVEMSQKQTEFIGTLGQSYTKLKQDLASVGDDEKKSTQIKKDLGATEDELAKIVGVDAAKRITSADDINAAISHEQEVHDQKTSDIKTALGKLVTTQKELRDNTIQYCNDRIDAINNEAVDFAKAADAIGKALGSIDEMMFKYYRNKQNYLNSKADEIEKEGNFQHTGQFLGGMGYTGVDADTTRVLANQAGQNADDIKNAAKAVAVGQSKEALGLGGHWNASDDGAPVGGDIAPDATEKKGRKEGAGETEYEQRKKEFEAANAKAEADAELAGSQRTLAEKLALYHEYMDNVAKVDDKHHQETVDNEKNIYKLQYDSQKEAIELKAAQYEREAVLAKAGVDKVHAAEAEIDRKKAAGIKLTPDEFDEDKYRQISAVEPAGSIAKANADIGEYKTVDKDNKDNAAKLKKQLEDKNKADMAENSLDDEKYKILFQNGMISGQELNVLNEANEAKRYETQKTFIQKTVTDKTEQIAKLEALDNEYSAKKMESDEKDYQYANRYQMAGLAAYQSGLEGALNGILNKTTSWGNSMRNLFDGLWKSIANQFSTDMSKKWTESLTQMLSSSKLTNNNIAADQKNLTNKLATGVQQQVTTVTQADTTKSNLGVQSDKTITDSAQKTTTSVLSSLGTMAAQMAEEMAIMYALSALFGGGGKSTSTSTSSVSLGRSASSYYTTPTAVSQITVPSFDIGATELPSNMLAMVHKGEMILPPELAANIRSLGSNTGGSQQSGRPMIINHSMNSSNIDNRGLRQAYQQSSREISNTIKREVRRFNTNPSPKYL